MVAGVLAPAAVDDDGEWLVATRAGWQAQEAGWLERLARFDRARGWTADGALSCADWLVARVGLARSTAFEKLRVAHEMTRRPLLADAFAAAGISYCKLRHLTRAVGADPATDEGLLRVARAGTVIDVARAVRCYLLHAEQDRRPAEHQPARGVRLVRRGDGTTRLEAVLTDLEAAEVERAIDALAATPGEKGERGEESARADSPGAAGPGALANWAGMDPSWLTRRTDALMELVRGGRPAPERYQVHVVVRDGSAALLGGEPPDPATAAMVRCDTATVAHHLDERGAPLRLGRTRRTWSTAQRRAVAVRDGGRCRWPGCERTHADLHHLTPWEHGGATEVDNAVLLCPRHHTLIHAGWRVTGDVNGTLVFHRPR